ncbi:putative reverse transcriptase domain-containing protein [Tanacetum coccineum]
MSRFDPGSPTTQARILTNGAKPSVNFQDEMMDMMDISNEIQESLGKSYSVRDDIDENELLGGKLIAKNLQDEMMDMMDISNEIQESLGKSYIVRDDIDENELLGAAASNTTNTVRLVATPINYETEVTIPSMVSMSNEYALKSQFDTSIYMHVMDIFVISVLPDSSEETVGTTPASPDYSPASDTESDPSEDPSSDHIPPLPATSPFLSFTDDSSDSDIPDTPPSPTHGTPFTDITLSTQSSPAASGALRSRVMILAPGQPIPHG